MDENRHSAMCTCQKGLSCMYSGARVSDQNDRDHYCIKSPTRPQIFLTSEDSKRIILLKKVSEFVLNSIVLCLEDN